MAYTGIKAKIPLGDIGLLTDVSPDRLPAGALIKARNVCFFNGNVQKAPGSIRWNSATAVSSGIVAIHHWKPTQDVERFIAVTDDGNIYKGKDRTFGSAINSTIAATLTPNCMFVAGGSETSIRNKKLFLFTEGRTNVQVLSGDGTAFGTIATPSTDWTSSVTYPQFGFIHRTRLWAFVGQRSYASNSSNHEDFVTSSLTDAVYPGEGGNLSGGFVFKGRAVVFKRGGFVYMLNDLDVSTANWYWQKISSNLGLSAPNAIVEALDDLLVGNVAGTITSYAASEKLGSVEASDIIQGIGFESHLRSETNRNGLDTQHMLYYPEKKILFVTYRSGYQVDNDMLLQIDFGRTGAPRAAYWNKGKPNCLALYQDTNKIDRPMYGDADGYLNLMDRETRTEGTASYTGEFQLSHTDFSYLDANLSSVEKHFDHLSVQYVPEGAGNLSCDYFIDGRYMDTVTFPMVQYSRPQLGTFTLGTDRFAQYHTELATRRIAGTGRTFSAQFSNAGQNQSFQVSNIIVSFRPGGDKAEQV